MSVTSDMDEAEAYKLCAKNEVATCPVVHDGKVTGIVTVHELVRGLTKVE